jgi:MFS family permease
VGEADRLERDSILNGSFAALTLNILSTFAPLLLLDSLHGTRQQVALLNSLPALVSVGSFLLAAVWLGHVKSLRRVVIWSAAIARFMVVLLAGVGFLPASIAAWAMVGLYALLNFPAALAGVSWQSLISAIIPAERRAAFFAERNRVVSIAGMGITIVAGGVLQFFPPADAAPYQVALAACAIFGALEIYYLTRHPDAVIVRPPKLAAAWRENFQVTDFRRYLWVATIFTFAWQSAWPLYTIYQIRFVHATALWLALFSVASAITSIVTYHWWGRQSLRLGIGPTLVVAAIGLGLSPFITVLVANLWWLVLTNLFTGIFLSGVTLLMFNQLLQVAPDQQRNSMLGLYNLALGIVGAVAPEFGVLVLHLLHMGMAMVVMSVLRIGTGLGFVIGAESGSLKGWVAWTRSFRWPPMRRRSV